MRHLRRLLLLLPCLALMGDICGGPPLVALGTTPEDGATGVPVATTVTINFDQDVNTMTAEGQFSLVKQSNPGGSIEGTLSFPSARLTFTPAAPLELDTAYVATLQAGTIKGGDHGNPLKAPVTFTFTTTAVLDVSPPTLVQTTPGPAATAVSRLATVRLDFSEAMLESSVTNSSLVAKDPGTQQGLAASYFVNGSAVTWHTLNVLAAGQTVELSYTAGLEDLEKNALANPGLVSFKVRGDDWQPRVAAAGPSSSGPASFAATSAAASGELVVWMGPGAGTQIGVFASFLAPDAGSWATPPATLAMVAIPVGPTPAVAADTAGNAIAVWTGSVSGTPQLQGSIYTRPGAASPGGWSAPVRIDDPVGEAPFDPRVEGDGAGTWMVVWRSAAQGTERIRARLFIAAWQPVVQVASVTGHMVKPELAMNADGQAMAVWSQAAGPLDPHETLMASRYASSAWSPPEKIDGDLEPSSAGYDVALDATGNAVAAWEQRKLLVNTYSYAAAGWLGPKELIGPSPGVFSVVGSPSVTYAPGGRAVVAWARSDGADYQVLASTLTAGGTQWNEQLIWRELYGTAFPPLGPKVTAIAGGVPEVLWKQSRDGNQNPAIASARQDLATGNWTEAMVVDHTNSATIRQLELLTTQGGSPFAVWVDKSELNSGIYSSAGINENK